MALNTYPYSPFPASTEQLHKGDNEDLQAQIDAIKDGTDIDSFGDVETALGVVTGDITELETDKADLEVVAPAFDAEAGTYDVGDQVTYDGKLYEFTSAHSTAGAWDPTEVTEKTVADEIGTVKSGLTDVNDVIDDVNSTPFLGATYPNGQIGGNSTITLPCWSKSAITTNYVRVYDINGDYIDITDNSSVVRVSPCAVQLNTVFNASHVGKHVFVSVSAT